MDLFDLEVDVEKEVSGVWREFDKETSFLIARMNNKAFLEEREKLVKPFDNVEMTDTQKEEVFCRCLSKTILLDWKGLKEKGQEISYNEAKCYEILSDPRFKEFRAWMFLQSSKVENFYSKNLEKKLGN